MKRLMTYDRRWTTTQGLFARWIETGVLMFAFLVLRMALGVDDSLDWGLWFRIVGLAAIVFTFFSAESSRKPTSTQLDEARPGNVWTVLRAVALSLLQMLGLGLFYLAGSQVLGSVDGLDWSRWALMSVAAAMAYAAIRIDDRRRDASRSSAFD